MSEKLPLGFKAGSIKVAGVGICPNCDIKSPQISGGVHVDDFSAPAGLPPLPGSNGRKH